MQKLLLTLFLLIISSLGVVGYIVATNNGNIEVEQHQPPANNETITIK